MDYKYSNDEFNDKRAVGNTSYEGTTVSQDGKAFKLIKFDYDIVIVVDDSTSMGTGGTITRWQECRKAISIITEAALQFVPGGIEIHFLNSPDNRTCRTPAEVNELFQSIRLRAETPTGAKLEQLLENYWRKLKESHRFFGPPVNPPKPVVFIVLTDGEPTDNPQDAIVKYAKKLQHAKWPKHQVGIQFVQVGDSIDAARSLRELDDGLKRKAKRDMVDYTIYDPGAVSRSAEDEHSLQAHLTKILVGAIDEEMDRKTAGNIYTKQRNLRRISQSTAPPPNYQRATSSRYW